MRNIYQKNTILTLVMVLVGLISSLSPALVHAETTESSKNTEAVEDIIDSKNNNHKSYEKKVNKAVNKMKDYSASELNYILKDLNSKDVLTEDEQAVVEAISIIRSHQNTKSVGKGFRNANLMLGGVGIMIGLYFLVYGD